MACSTFSKVLEQLKEFSISKQHILLPPLLGFRRGPTTYTGVVSTNGNERSTSSYLPMKILAEQLKANMHQTRGGQMDGQ